MGIFPNMPELPPIRKTNKPRTKMTIFESFEQLSLTNQQKEAVEKIDKFLSSTAQIFLLKGYAGTGKTTILEGIAKYCRKTNRKPTLMAPTGRAARVITEKTGIEGNTIHRTIYSWEIIEEKGDKKEKERKHGDDLSYRFHFQIKNNDESGNNSSIYLVDEASMISNKFSADKYFIFGTGHLLNDLFTYFGNPKHHNRKIVFIGDPAQLPPVGSPNSPALIKEEIRKINQHFEIWEYELTEVLRQKSDSGILHNSNILRDSIKKKSFSNLTFDTSFNDISEINIPKLWESWNSSVKDKGLDETILITETNATAKELNDLIRNNLFPKKSELQVGDIVIINQNNTIYKLNNGEFAKVVEVGRVVSVNVRIRKKPKPVIVPLTFRDLKIEYYNYLSKRKEIIAVKIIENLLHSHIRDLSDDEKDALYIHYRIRTWNKNTYPETPDFALDIKDDIYFNSLRIKYGYAITCHKAQGGEWKNAIIRFEKERKHQANENYFRWVYTSITRSKENLLVINPPKIKLTDKTAIHPIEQISKKNIPIQYESIVSDVSSPFHNNPDYEFLIQKYIELNAKCNLHGIKIINVESKPQNYHDRYTFQEDELTTRIDFYFKKGGKFTRVNPVGNKNELSEKIIKLNDLPNSGTDRKIIPFTYKGEDSTKKRTYKIVDEAVKINNSIIVYITEEAWCLNIYIKTKADTSFFKIYHTKRGFISEIFPKSSLGAEDEILDNICITLQNMIT